MSLVLGKTDSGFLTRSDTNPAVKPLNMSRCLKFRIYEEEDFYYSCSGYHEADLRFCFLVCKKAGFLMTSFIWAISKLSLGSLP